MKIMISYSLRMFPGLVTVATSVMLSIGAGCAAEPSTPSAASVPVGKSVIVAADGSGDYKTVQEAVDAAPKDSKSTRFVIRIKAGKYEGNVIVPQNKPNVVFEGEGAEKTVISWNRNVNDPIPAGADKFNPGLYVAASDFRASDLTFENTAGDRGQALAVRVDGDRAAFENCRFLGWQDTLMVNNGRQYFKNCYIEGRVDFIYGSGTAVFDTCHIHSKNGGYVTAASTPQEAPYGFVFLNCKLTGDATPWVDPTGAIAPKVWKLPNARLGRPWRPYASVTFINSEMGNHIMPEGWNNWGKVENEKTARYAEYNSQTLEGKPLDVSGRAPWTKQLTAEEAAQYTIPNVLGGKDSESPFGKRSLVVRKPANPIDAPPGTLPAQNVTIYGTNARLENNGANIGFWSNTDTSFEWTSNVQPGTYLVALNYALASAGTEFEVAVGDKSFRLTPPVTGGFGNYKTVEVGEVEIKQTNTPVTVSALSQKSTFIMNIREVTLSKK